MRKQISAATPRSTREADLEHAEFQAHPLYHVFMAAIQQAMYGKGERHGGAKIPFMDQPWNHYAGMHGRGFLTGQASKKLEEAASTRHGEEFINEVLGALVYAGAAILHEENRINPFNEEPIK